MNELLTLIGLLGPPVVGAVFLASGLIKALDLQQVVRHLARLRLFPRGMVASLAVTLVGLECALGTALLVGFHLRVLLPVAGATVLGLAAVTWWSVGTGRVEDCGCYGGLIDLSPRTSMILDLVYLALLLAAWVSPHRPVVSSSGWRLAAVLAAAAVGSGLGALSHWRTLATGSPLLAFGPLKEGRRWSSRWLRDPVVDEAVAGRVILVFLSPACTLCKRWVGLLNVAQGVASAPNVVGVVALPPDAVPDFERSTGVRFPVVSARPWSLKRLTRGEIPTAVLIEGGTIRELWVRALPAKLVEEIRQGMLASARGAGSTG